MKRDNPKRDKANSKGFVKRQRPKICQFCSDKTTYIDYKDAALMRRYVSDRGKIRARRVSGCCARHQQDIAMAVKNAREMALLPYVIR